MLDVSYRPIDDLTYMPGDPGWYAEQVCAARIIVRLKRDQDPMDVVHRFESIPGHATHAAGVPSNGLCETNVFLTTPLARKSFREAVESILREGEAELVSIDEYKFVWG